MDCHAEALAKASKELKLSQEAYVKAQSSAESAARQADKLTQKLANMPKVQNKTLASQPWSSVDKCLMSVHHVCRLKLIHSKPRRVMTGNAAFVLVQQALKPDAD